MGAGKMISEIQKWCIGGCLDNHNRLCPRTHFENHGYYPVQYLASVSHQIGTPFNIRHRSTERPTTRHTSALEDWLAVRPERNWAVDFELASQWMDDDWGNSGKEHCVLATFRRAPRTVRWKWVEPVKQSCRSACQNRSKCLNLPPPWNTIKPYCEIQTVLRFFRFSLRKCTVLPCLTQKRVDW